MLSLEEIDGQSVEENDEHSVINAYPSIKNEEGWAENDEEEHEKSAWIQMVFEDDPLVENCESRNDKEKKNKRSSNEVSNEDSWFFAKDRIYADRYFGKGSEDSKNQERGGKRG